MKESQEQLNREEPFIWENFTRKLFMLSAFVQPVYQDLSCLNNNLASEVGLPTFPYKGNQFIVVNRAYM